MIFLFLTSGCENPTINPPELQVSAEEIDFGVVPSRTEAVQSFTLTNSGSGVITVLSVQLIDGEWKIAHYALTMLVPNTIAEDVGSQTQEADKL